MRSIAKLYGEAVKRDLFSEVEARNGFDRILPIYGEGPLREVALVVEAAVEKLDL
ncbi:MAG: hypothetical protein JOZ60_09560 [Verrucomicrobia bacterium]|nr:hypothetical protein [Verrucomicrobiota bacterium]